MKEHRTQVHGHRGCSGPEPENTVPAFLRAAATGCQWLELDVVITGDDTVLVSHEPWMDHRTCRDPQGRPLTEAEGRATNIFTLPLAEVQRYRCVPSGSDDAKGADPSWYKPALGEVVRAVDALAQRTGIVPPGYTIEVKSERGWYGTYQPVPERLAERMLQEVDALGILHRCIIQSFDGAVLKAIHASAPAVPLCLLAERPEVPATVLDHLGFTPAYYGPTIDTVDASLAEDLRSHGIGLLVWTVNTKAGMERLLDIGVDGIITDHPAMAMALLADRQ